MRLFCHWRGSSSLTPVADSLSLIFELLLTRIDDLNPNVLPLSYRIIFINQRRNTARIQEAARSTAGREALLSLSERLGLENEEHVALCLETEGHLLGKEVQILMTAFVLFFFFPYLHFPTQSLLKHRWCDLALHLQNYLHLKWALIRTHIYNSANRHRGY